MNRATGLTVLELLVALSVIGILATLGIPTFRDLILDLRMTSQINSFVHAIHLAKHEAYKRVAPVALCKSNNGTQCTDDRHWHEGWIVFVNRNRKEPPRVDPGEPILAVYSAYKAGLITGNRRSFVFRPFEIRSTNGTLSFCDQRGPEHARAVVVSYTGRPRVTDGAWARRKLLCPE